MSSFLNRSLGLPPAIPNGSSSKVFLVDDHHRGLISGDNANRVTSSVLRRTLSAAELYPKSGAIKKTASVENLHRLSGEDGNGFGSGSGAIEDIWSSIQKKTEDSEQRQSSVDVWGSILSEKTAQNDDVSREYVHPLVKRSASCLSEKSLEICTESLGSETGADGFSSDDQNDVVAVVVATEEEQIKEVGPVSAVRIYNPPKKVGTVANRSSAFPPPLPSLGLRSGGANLHMRSHRENGRLVLEAVSVPSRNCFQAERNGGRLLLTFSDDVNSDEMAGDEVVEDDEDWEEEDDIQEDEGVVMDKEMKAGAAIVMKRAGMVHYKFLCLTRTGPWADRLNKVVNNLDYNDDDDDNDNGVDIQVTSSALAQSLSMGSKNKYVYSWRNKSALTSSSATTVEKMKDAGVVVVEAAVGKGYDYKLLPFLKGCNKLNQPKRASLLRC